MGFYDLCSNASMPVTPSVPSEQIIMLLVLCSVVLMGVGMFCIALVFGGGCLCLLGKTRSTNTETMPFMLDEESDRDQGT